MSGWALYRGVSTIFGSVRFIVRRPSFRICPLDEPKGTRLSSDFRFVDAVSPLVILNGKTVLPEGCRRGEGRTNLCLLTS